MNLIFIIEAHDQFVRKLKKLRQIIRPVERIFDRI